VIPIEIKERESERERERERERRNPSSQKNKINIRMLYTSHNQNIFVYNIRMYIVIIKIENCGITIFVVNLSRL